MTTLTATDKQLRFQAIVVPQLPKLYSMARRIAGVDAEDAVQEALLKAFQGIDQLSNEESAPGWLATILVNSCRDRGRAQARRPQEIHMDEVDDFSLYRKIADEDPFPYSDSLHLDFLQQFGREDVREILLSLPEIYRVPLVLVHMDGFAGKEVAEMLGVPLGTVLARLHRGRKLFERCMWEYAGANGLLKEGVG